MNGWNARNNYGQTGHSRGGDRGYERSYGRDDNRGRGGDYENYPNRGAMFAVTDKRSDSSPDYNGYITFTAEVLDYVTREIERGVEEVRLEISGWRRMSRNNSAFTSLATNIPYKVRMEEQGNSTYRARPNYNQRQSERPRQSARQSYAEQSGRNGRDDDFSRGDRMPSFTQGQRDRDRDPNAPPF